MKKLIFFLFLATFNTLLFAQPTDIQTFDYEGLEREYFLYLPVGYDPADKLPVVFNFHGITSDFGEQYSYTGFFGGMNAVADTGNFIVCYPNGTKIPSDDGFEWNVGFNFSSSTADDVGFVNALIDTLAANYNINLNQVYATGMSNGGYMAYKLACELTDRFQAIASVTGSMVPSELMACNPSKTIPVMQIHNTNDDVVLYNGSAFGVSMDNLLDKWITENACDDMQMDSVAMPDIDPMDGSTVDKFTWSSCDSDRKVVHFRVNGGAHTWPGSVLTFAPTNNDILASKEIWDFFRQYGTPFVTSTKDQTDLAAEITINPNPFNNYILIESPNAAIASISIYDALGKQMVTQQNINARRYEINQLDFIPGVYYVQVENRLGVKVIKLIKD